MRWSYIAFDGPIGVGKTALVNELADRLDSAKLLEDVSNPFLEEFYEEKPGAAFQTQLFYLLSRYRKLVDAAQQDLFSTLTLADHTFQKDRIFAYLTLSDSELMLYDRLYGMLEPKVPKPDLVVYLQASTDVLMRRIQKRARPEEQRISYEYLEEVNLAFSHYYYRYQDTPLLVINISDIDFVDNPGDVDDLLEQIESMEGGTQVYVPRHAE